MRPLPISARPKGAQTARFYKGKIMDFNELFEKHFKKAEPKADTLTSAEKRRGHEEFNQDRVEAARLGMPLKEYRELIGV